jgi:hypothetical protein
LIDLGNCPFFILHFDRKEHISRHLADEVPKEHLPFCAVMRKSSEDLDVLGLIDFNLVSIEEQIGRAMVSLGGHILLNFRVACQNHCILAGIKGSDYHKMML